MAKKAEESVTVGKKTYDMGTEIRINIKTLMIFLGVVIPGITGLYYKLESSISNTKQEIQQQVKPLEEQVRIINEKMIVIGINVENTNKTQENIQKNVDRLIIKLIPESKPNSTIEVEDTNPDRVKINGK